MKIKTLLSEHFDPAYVRPKILLRATQELLPLKDITRSAQPKVPFSERRLRVRRREQRRAERQPILLDLRGSQARRRSPGRRRSDHANGYRADGHTGIDTYA